MGNPQRERQKARKKEAYLESRNLWGHKDSTPQQATANIIEKKRSENNETKQI